MSIRETVLAAVRRGFRGDDQIVQPEKTFDEIGIDSLDLIEIVIEIEDALGIQIADVAFSELQTVQDLIDTAERASS